MFGSDVVYLQRFLKAEGLYQGLVDNDYGSKTEAAKAEHDRLTKEIANRYGMDDEFRITNELCICTLLLPAQIEARKFLARIKPAGLRAHLTWGGRTYNEQAKIYAQGRTAPGNIVTDAKPGRSLHNFGIAWDVGIFDSHGRYIWIDELFDKLGTIGIAPEIQWGGNWKKPDRPHWQLNFSMPANVMQKHFEAGTFHHRILQDWRYQQQ